MRMVGALSGLTTAWAPNVCRGFHGPQRTPNTILGRVVHVHDGTGLSRDFVYDGEHDRVEARDNHSLVRMAHGPLGTITSRIEARTEAEFG